MLNKILYYSLRNTKHPKNDYTIYDGKRNNYRNKNYQLTILPSILYTYY